MRRRRYDIVILRDERRPIDLDAVAKQAGLHPALVARYAEAGLIEPVAWEGTNLMFDPSVIPRLRVIERLRSDLCINLSGVAVILDMVERLRALQSENDLLRSRL